MTKEMLQVIFGCLLHDVGKVIYRDGEDRRKHSQSGYDFLKTEAGIEDQDLLHCVLYHHYDALKNAKLSKTSPAYISYIADNIAAAFDRRKNDTGDFGFEVSAPLESVFNILNNNHKTCYYEPKTLDPKDGILYPVTEKKPFDQAFYKKIKRNFLENLKGIEYEPEYVNSLLEVLEANLSYIPASTAKSERADISLFDHVKLTAAVGSCIYEWMLENDIQDYKEMLLSNAKEIYGKEIFLLYSMDISGIQNFIYTIVSENALKTLRAKSFYLEILMEHMIDLLLEKLNLSRANLLYVGGGNCYLLLPNTANTKETLESFNKELNAWLREFFDISLYVAHGYKECSSMDLNNEPNGSYAEVFRGVGNMISIQKSHRYCVNELIWLNEKGAKDYDRECKVCKKIGQVNEKGLCILCSAIEKFSVHILRDEFFIISCEDREGSLPMPGNYYLSSVNNKEELVNELKNDRVVRCYGKNKMYTGKMISTKLWVGDYTSKKTFEEMAEEADGIHRIGVLRADVDNLGNAFVSGFNNEENKNRYVTLSRTATLSRQLSLFFKLYVNSILENPKFQIGQGSVKKRNVSICYSGGDDVFIVGAWNEVIEAAVDLKNCFEKYTLGTLTISAGIGLYPSKYPISVMAKEVGHLEELSKKNIGKNSITLLEDGRTHLIKKEEKILEISDGTFYWDEFEHHVIKEKYEVIDQYFSNTEDKGNSFLYHMLELIRNQEDKINFARFVYLIARMEPEEHASEEEKERYNSLSQKLYFWIKDAKACRQLKTAITLYVYMNRKEG